MVATGDRAPSTAGYSLLSRLRPASHARHVACAPPLLCVLPHQRRASLQQWHERSCEGTFSEKIPGPILVLCRVLLSNPTRYCPLPPRHARGSITHSADRRAYHPTSTAHRAPRTAKDIGACTRRLGDAVVVEPHDGIVGQVYRRSLCTCLRGHAHPCN